MKATVSFITKRLINKLKIKIKEKLTSKIVIITGARAKTLGNIRNLKIIL